MIVRFPEEAGPPGGAGGLKLKIDAPAGGPSLLVELAPAGGPRQFAAAWTPELAGLHEAVMLGPTGPTGVGGRVAVRPRQGEADRLKLDEADLREASRQPGGGYRAWAGAEELFELAEVPEPSALDRPAEPWEVWNHPVAVRVNVRALGLRVGGAAAEGVGLRVPTWGPIKNRPPRRGVAISDGLPYHRDRCRAVSYPWFSCRACSSPGRRGRRIATTTPTIRTRTSTSERPTMTGRPITTPKKTPSHSPTT